MVNIKTREDLQTLLSILPQSIRDYLNKQGREDELLEVVMDLGRIPSARYINGEIDIRLDEVTRAEIDQVIEGIGEFDDDNRAGIARTLHRISGIKNRHDQVVGLTCRVGRAVYGTIEIIQDIVDDGHSILLLGRPGVGKTTMLREMARVLADKKRVVIVDTSNEIGGDGDIPHPAVGKARRMQVPRPSHQHETMIEAVENHSPEVVVIDEIGRQQEAEAARTINERGVQLIGTAHGNTLENLLLNPTLSDLVGGIESVTLSDEEARRRGTQKTVLERRAPPTFDILIEIQERQRLLVHRDVTDSVDRMLRGEPLQVELRYRDEEGKIHAELQSMVSSSPAVTGRRGGRGLNDTRRSGKGRGSQSTTVSQGKNGRRHTIQATERTVLAEKNPVDSESSRERRLKIYAYGVARNRLHDAAKSLGTSIEIVDRLEDADVLVTLKSYYRRRRRLISDAEQSRKPVYVLRANTVRQMERFLVEAMNLEIAPNDPFAEAIAEAAEAIELIAAGQPSADLEPAGSAIRRYQHQMARKANLVSHSYGKEPRRHVRIFNTRRNQ
ncbi:MAG: R3H domain-containing nucleic acid-binding protein [Candidatus Promineifilaceae bacterium]|nr:R3H domain-containing nucleic acid-binding protein [Candidatus Promineifilaceae bacterium]